MSTQYQCTFNGRISDKIWTQNKSGISLLRQIEMIALESKFLLLNCDSENKGESKSHTKDQMAKIVEKISWIYEC